LRDRWPIASRVSAALRRPSVAEEVGLYRELAAANPQAYTPDVAMSLGTLCGARMRTALWDR
jgi:hypothetical protein